MTNLYIVWTERNLVGVPIIDEQHRGIVSTINSFHYLIHSGHGEEALKPTMAILEYYTLIHFKTEEALMERAKYPNLGDHKLLHKELYQKTRNIPKDPSFSEDPNIALKFLREWWLNHINIEDKKYAPYVKKLID